MKNYLNVIALLFSLSMYSQEFITVDGITDFTCEGRLFDTGGIDGDIASDTDVTYTICPEEGQDLRIALDFSTFNFPAALISETFIIYDANQVDDDAILYTSVSGVVPGFVQASDFNTSGCLTIRVVTGFLDGFSPAYEADISCEEPCQIIEAEITSIEPSEIQNGDYVVFYSEELTLSADGIFGDTHSSGSTYLWDFGDGNTATGQTVNHIYSDLGSFQINVTVIDANGCVSFNTLNQNVNVAIKNDPIGTGCPEIDLPDIIELGCSETDVVSATITANFFDTGNTDQYTISQIPYSPPFAFFGGSFLNVTADDDWSPLIDLGFDFVFFENTYENALVTDNGAVSFYIQDITPTGTYVPGGDSGFSFNEQIPHNPGNGGPPYLDAIFGVLQDLNPNESLDDYSLNFQVLGEAPCRSLVFNLYNMGHFSCGTSNGAQTSQIVLYETTNAIEVYVNQRTPCPAFNIGSGTIGIQNSTGTVGYAPPGRNTGAWSANNEAWRFTPSGESIVSIEWFDENDNSIGVGEELTVTPDTFGFDINIPDIQETTIRVVATYAINDNPTDDVVVEDTAIIRYRQDYSVELLDEYIGCSTTGVELELEFEFFDENLSEEDLTIEWFLDGELIADENESIYLAEETGQYSAIVSSDECSISVSTEVEIFEPPTINTIPDDIFIQTESVDEVVFLDLTIYDLAFFDLDSSIFELSYYELATDAENQINPILNPENYQVLNQLQTIFIGISYINEELNVVCDTIISYEIRLIPVTPSTPEDLNECALEGELLSNFDLTENEALIYVDNDPDDFSIFYFDSEENLLANENPIEDPTSYNASETNQTIYVLLVDTENPQFFVFSQFQIVSYQIPIIDDEVEISACGDFTFTQEVDLMSSEEAIFNGPNTNNVDLDFFTSLADASNNENPILNTLFNPTQAQTNFYYRASNPNLSECFSLGSLTVFINNVEIGNSPENLQQCQDGSGNPFIFFDLSLNNALVFGPNQTPATQSVTYYTSLEDANAGVNFIQDPTTFISNFPTQEIWVRVSHINDESCFEVASFFIEATEPSEVNLNLEPLEACDENNDGFFSNFDLDSRIEAINFLDNPDVQVSFHPTPTDVQNNQNPLTSPYANVVPGQQTVYVRIFDGSNGCLQTTTFDLIVYDSPLLLDIDPFVICDTNENGIQFFDLTQVEDNLFVPGQDTTDFVITYHLSEEAALNNTGLIGNPEAFQNTISPQTVYVRISDPASPLGCFNIEPIELIVEPLPEIIPPTLIAECDDIESGSNVDEVSTFNLFQKIPEITNNDNTLFLEFFETEEDQANSNPILNIQAYQNIINPQTIEVSVYSQYTDCIATTTLTLVVDPLPTIPIPETLIVCDADNEGTSEFDLLAAVEDILDGEVNTQITFHLTEVEAFNNISPIPIEDANGNSILFQNTNLFTQTLYIRAENIGNANLNGTGCFTIRPLELQVVESPRIEELEDLVICDDESLNGFAPFDLVQNTANAIGEQESENLVVTYHVSQADAELGLNEISVPSNYTNITNPQTIYVRLFDTETECVDLFGFTDDNSFTITVEPYPDLITPTPLEVCNTTANSEASFPTGIFDLTSKQEELTGLSPVPGNISFTYYESEEDLLNQESPIENPEEYINSAAPPMLIYVEATNTSTENQCSNTSTITLSVLPLPFPVELTEEELRLTACDDDNDGIAADPFDLTQIGQQITGSENNVGSYYLTEDAAINEDIAQQIADPTAYVNEPALNELDEDFFPTNTQIVWVRLDSNAVGNFCFVVVQIELIVEPNPELNPAGIPFGYTLCEGEPTQLPTVEEIVFSLYDVTNGSPNEIIPVLDPANTAQDPADYEYSLHLTEAEAEAGTNPVAVGYEATDGEILYLRVTHIITECYNIGNIPEVQITIEPRPEITDTDLSPIVVCADEQLNDADQAENQEVATIDLTQRDAEIDPNFEDPDSNTLVEYYASEEDLNNGIPIEDPTNFTTTETPTTIFALVIDLDNFCSSFTSQSFEIQVNPIPLVDISDMDGSIVCINPQTGEVINTDFSPPILDTQLSEEFYSFEWTLNGTPIAFTGSAYTVDGPGIYTVTVTDITNNQTSCQASSSAEIIQSNGPSFEVNVLSLAFDGSHSVEVTNIQGDGDYEFQVDNGPWRSLAEGETSIIFTGLDAGERIVRGRDLGGCGEVEIIVSLIDYPRFFTPNEDGYNDTWNIIGLANQANAKIYIFDRYGKLLKQISPSGQGWDGTYNGKVMVGNDYWFRVEYDEPANGARKEFKANFTLKR